MNSLLVEEAAVDILAENTRVNVTVLSQIKLTSVLDTWMTPHKHYEDML